MVSLDERKHAVSSLSGLSRNEVAQRQAERGANRIQLRSSRSYGRILGQNLFSFLNLLIISIAAILALLTQYVDAMLTASTAIINVSVATIQEIRAKRQLDRIALLTRSRATTIREGVEQQVELEEIVVDDLLVLRPGDQVVADGTVVSDGYASVDESLLTGESKPVQKAAGDTLYSGSFLLTGSAVYRATAIGEGSLAHQMSQQARQFKNTRTPLQSEITWLMRGLLIVLLLMSLQVLNTINNLYQAFPLEEVARNASVIVGLVPQGLVLMVVVTYAVAIVRLAGKGVLVQRMNAVESLSHVDMLCLDKTGTITTNNLQLEEVIPLGGDEPAIRAALGDTIASATSGSRTTEAIAREIAGERLPVRFELPFSSAYKWSGVAIDDPQRKGTYLIGAPESLLPGIRNADEFRARLAELTSQGKRTLFFAGHADVLDLGTETDPRLPPNLVPLAIVVITDELRHDARSTIAGFMEAGIQTRIISGDNPETVAALVRQAGIPVTGERPAVAGSEIDAMDDAELSAVVKDATVFGRISPQQKARLVEALKAQDHYVAMVGDGVNDVPALKAADVAVAMRTGSEVTRSVAHLVLVDDSFAVLPQTFIEGQRIRNGMKLSMELFLTRTFYTMLVIYVIALMGDMFPIALRHGALVSILTVGTPAFALALFAQPGKSPRRLLPDVFRVITPAAVTIGALLLIVYQFTLYLADDLQRAQSALTTTAMLCGLIYIAFLQPPLPAFTGARAEVTDRRPALLALGLLGLYALIAAIPQLRSFFDLRTLSLSGYLLIATAVTGWAVILRLAWRLRVMDLLATELGKAWSRLRHRFRRASPDQNAADAS